MYIVPDEKIAYSGLYAGDLSRGYLPYCESRRRGRYAEGMIS